MYRCSELIRITCTAFTIIVLIPDGSVPLQFLDSFSIIFLAYTKVCRDSFFTQTGWVGTIAGWHRVFGLSYCTVASNVLVPETCHQLTIFVTYMYKAVSHGYLVLSVGGLCIQCSCWVDECVNCLASVFYPGSSIPIFFHVVWKGLRLCMHDILFTDAV